MSHIQLNGSASGSGTVALNAPVTNSNRALALPDVSGELAVFGRHVVVLTATRQLGVTYTNTSKVWRTVYVTVESMVVSGALLDIRIEGEPITYLITGGTTTRTLCCFIVPPGASYFCSSDSAMNYWVELQ